MSKKWFPLCVGSTQVSLFCKNPLDWYEVALVGGESIPNENMVRGLMAHNQIACLMGGTSHPVEGAEYLSPDQLDAATATAEQFVGIFETEAWRFAPLKYERIPVVEYTFTLDLPELPVPLEGTLDFCGLMDGKLTMVDWKTTRQTTDRWLSTNRGGIQQYVYGLWFHNVIDSDAETIPFHYVLIGQDGKDGPLGVRDIDASISVEEMMSWYKNVLVPVAWAMKGMWFQR